MSKRAQRLTLVNSLAGLVQPVIQNRRAPERPLSEIPGFSVRNASSDITEMLIYGTIGQASWWDMGGVTAADFAQQLNEINSANIHVRINSGGGDVFDGVAIHTMLCRHSATVTTFNDGLAASAASFILQAGDRVVSSRYAMTMIHDASTGVYGNQADLIAEAELLGKVSDVIADVYANRAGEDVEFWRAAMRAETWYTGPEALTAGLVDEITDADEEDSATDRLRNSLSGWRSRFRNAPPLPPVRTPVRPSLEQESEDEYRYAMAMAHYLNLNH